MNITIKELPRTDIQTVHSSVEDPSGIGGIVKKSMGYFPEVVGWGLHFFTREAKVLVTLFVPNASGPRLGERIEAMRCHIINSIPAAHDVEVEAIGPGTLVSMVHGGTVIGHVAAMRFVGNDSIVCVDIERHQGVHRKVEMNHYELRRATREPYITPGAMRAVIAGQRFAPDDAVLMLAAGEVPHVVERAEDMHRVCNEQLERACKAVESLSSELAATRNDREHYQLMLTDAKNEHQETRARMGDWLGDKDREIKEVRAALGEYVTKNQNLEREIARLRKAKR